MKLAGVHLSGQWLNHAIGGLAKEGRPAQYGCGPPRAADQCGAESIGLLELTRFGKGTSWPELGRSYRDPAGGAIVVVLTEPISPGVLRCAGVPMIPGRALPCSYRTGTRVWTALQPGLRYRDPTSGLEVRCLCGGNGRLTYEHRELVPTREPGR